jgi:hypothetical protein
MRSNRRTSGGLATPYFILMAGLVRENITFRKLMALCNVTETDNVIKRRKFVKDTRGGTAEYVCVLSGFELEK